MDLEIVVYYDASAKSVQAAGAPEKWVERSVMDDLAAFLAISAVVIMTPGPDTALTVRNTSLGGRPAGFATAAGVAAGQAVWAFATSAGLVALLASCEPLFLAIRYAGAAYLIYLGARALRAAMRPEAAIHTHTSSDFAEGLHTAARRAFRQGLLSNLANPKMAVFFASLLPQFAGTENAVFSGAFALSLTFCVMTLAWLTCLAAGLSRVGRLLRRPALRRALEGALGAFLVGMGVRLAVAAR